MLVTAALLVPAAATAQGGKVLDARRLETIRGQMEKGQGLFVAGDYEAAAKVFEQGYADNPYPAFLFNAGVAYQKLGRLDDAITKFRAYVAADPSAPDRAKVEERIAKLSAARAPTPPPTLGDAGAGDAGDGGLGDAGAGDGGAALPPPVPTLPPDITANMKSLVIVETEPPGAPIHLFEKTRDSAAPFRRGAENSGWREVVSRPSPVSLSLDVGDYHLVIDRYRDFNPTDTAIRIEPGRVFHFRANLSQGDFMGFLRVTANVEGAEIRLDDKDRKRPRWGRSPHGELVARGEHTVLVEAPGFQPLFRKVEVKQAQEVDLTVKLVRVGFGYLRINANAPEIKVEVDGKAVGVWRSGEVPLETKQDAGDHHLVIRADGYKTYDGMVKVPKGQTLPVHAEMIPTYPRGAAWTQAIIGAAFIGAGTYLGIKSNQLHSELEADRKAGVLESDDERIKRGRLFAIGADAGFAIGGVLAVLATVNFIKDPLPDSGAHVDRPVEFGAPSRKAAALRRRRQLAGPSFDLTPALGPAGGGLFIGGRF